MIMIANYTLQFFCSFLIMICNLFIICCRCLFNKLNIIIWVSFTMLWEDLCCCTSCLIFFQHFANDGTILYIIIMLVVALENIVIRYMLGDQYPFFVDYYLEKDYKKRNRTRTVYIVVDSNII
eukprot:UN02206